MFSVEARVGNLFCRQYSDHVLYTSATSWWQNTVSGGGGVKVLSGAVRTVRTMAAGLGDAVRFVPVCRERYMAHVRS